MTSRTRSRNESYVEKGIGEKAALNKSSKEVDYGNLIGVQFDGHWWLGQVVDEKTVNNKPVKKLAGEVLVRLYGSYTYLYVDPIKSQLGYEKIIKKHQGSHIDILEEALKQDLLHVKSGEMKMGDKKSNAGLLGAGACQGKKTNKNNKSQDTTPSTVAAASREECTPSSRRLKVMQALGLIAPIGSPFCPK